MKILITGGCGFIGSHVVRYFVSKYPQHEIINLDKLTYAGNPDNLKDIKEAKNYRFVWGDVSNFELLREILQDVDAIIHLAAESHVDNSVGDSLIFTKSNTYGTHVLLEAARNANVKRIIHISTDEVYGDILEGAFTEKDKLEPNNPYSASKAAAEMIVRAYYKTYKLPIIMTRGNNVYGPNQYPEKIIPRFITCSIMGEKLPLHGNGSNIRTYQHVQDAVASIALIFEKGEIGEIYNIGSEDEVSNIEIAKKILNAFDLDEGNIDFVTDRPFNDKRYSIDLSKIKALGWQQSISFDEGLAETIAWYKDNPQWWRSLL